MHFLDLVSQNLLSPNILFFALGIVAGFLKSDLEVPESISRYLSIYLMMAIGFKGGVAITNTAEISLPMLGSVGAGLSISFLMPFLGYALIRLTTSLDKATAAATAAHYGSISMVTFVTATSFLKMEGLSYAGYIVAILALMEAPAILSGLFIAHRAAPETRGHALEEKKLSREIFTNGAILLLLGSFAVGALSGKSGLEKLSGFLVIPFDGFLCLFLLDMGLLVAKNLVHLRAFSIPLFLFGLYMPCIGAAIGLLTALGLSLDVGTGMLFIVLCASASYIAVPAAMRLALPEAKVAVYLPMSLAITFPFNITVGLPCYYWIAKHFLTVAV